MASCDDQVRLQRTRRAVRRPRPFLASRLIYYRFPKAAAGIGYAVEELPAKVFLASVLEVDDQRYNAEQIRALYDSESFPLSRKQPSS